MQVTGSARWVLAGIAIFALWMQSLCGEKAISSPTLADGVRVMQEGRLDEARLIFEELLAQNPGNRGASNYLAQIQNRQAAARKAEGRLSAVVFPSVNFEDQSLGDVLDHLTLEVAKRSEGKTALNFVRIIPPETARERKVNLSLQNIPVNDLLAYIGAQTGVQFVIEAHAVRVLPASKD